jgi:hypothetical protein
MKGCQYDLRAQKFFILEIIFAFQNTMSLKVLGCIVLAASLAVGANGQVDDGTPLNVTANARDAKGK